METIQLNGNGQLRTGRTELDVRHAGRIITHVLPLVGPGKYQNVMNAISQEGLLRPTTGQTFSLVNLALQNPDEDYCKTILSRFKNQYFWTSTENIWGKEDVIVYDNIDGKMPSDRKGLLKRLKDGDKSVRVVPYGFKTGSQSVSDLVKNPYIIAQVGDLPLEVVAEIAKKVSKFDPFVYALNSTREDTKRYTAVNSGWDGNWLDVGGDCLDDGGDGCASGVCKGAEGTAKK